MSVLYEDQQLSAEQRGALELLADAGEQSCPGATFLAYGFKVDLLAELAWRTCRGAPPTSEGG